MFNRRKIVQFEPTPVEPGPVDETGYLFEYSFEDEGNQLTSDGFHAGIWVKLEWDLFFNDEHVAGQTLSISKSEVDEVVAIEREKAIERDQRRRRYEDDFPYEYGKVYTIP